MLTILDALLQGWVGYALGCMLPTHSAWPFAEPAERWKLSAGLLRVLMAGLRCPASTPGQEGLSRALADVLSVPGAASSCLAAALPPDAGALMAALHGCT